MPTEKRDYYSGALLFVPTREERTTKRLKEDLRSELDEVKKIKEEYMEELNKLREDINR